MLTWLMTRCPGLRSPIMWRTLWRFVIWVVCDCRRDGVTSSTGGRCDSCGRLDSWERERRAAIAQFRREGMSLERATAAVEGFDDAEFERAFGRPINDEVE